MRTTPAKMRSPRRLLRGAVGGCSGPVTSGETVAVTAGSLRVDGYGGDRAPPYPSRGGQLPEAIFETIAVAFCDSAEVSGAEPAADAAACWPSAETM